jgi:hypothetical protein
VGARGGLTTPPDLDHSSTSVFIKYINIYNLHIFITKINIIFFALLFPFSLKCQSLWIALKVHKCEIFGRSDFHDFYTIKSFWVGDFEVKI